MSTGPERASGNDETETRPRDVSHTTGAPVSDQSSGSDSVSRRQALAAVGSLSLGATAGCLDSVRALVQDRVPVEPVDPGDERHGTPGEFYFFLEENGITVDELYRDTAENDLILFYESDAEDRSASENEIWIIYRVFSGALVDRGSDINHLYTEVVDESRFDGQVEGWGVNAEWAEDHLAGEISDLDVWNAIINTKVYNEGSNPYILNSDDDATGDDEAFGGETDDPVVGGDEDEDGNGDEDADTSEDEDEDSGASEDTDEDAADGTDDGDDSDDGDETNEAEESDEE